MMTETHLSICMATFRRGAFIAETLDSILPQLRPGIELVIVDGASPDNTAEVVQPYLRDWPQLRYYREAENSGVDADYDKAVGYAQGRYVWLMTDDDLLKPNAVDRVLELLLAEDPDLLVIDAEVLDVHCAQPLQARRFGFAGLRRYGAADRDQLIADSGDPLSFIGGTIIRRQLWMERDRHSYYGSLFIHVGVIFQSPISNVLLLGEPLIQIRFGNAMWTARNFEIWMFMWPELIWSFPGFSEEAKARVTAAEPWRIPRKMLGFRANGSYGLAEYRRFFARRPVGIWRLALLAFALTPGRVANLIAMLLLLMMRGRYRPACYALAWNSKFSISLSRRLAAVSLRRHPS
ncbi:glycosyltransferase family 2 protein [Sphingomonas sp. LaA6.9]|uniref:glycosyltransferase family 2 protein n=1 Tax=Sphingomonas sp. LaA6.9 TaxID=2919914 RepID=UPI001F4F4AB1|nr:glycosyltransferase family 2 protein [Sphingomonas sp. LaA6.9]MCJ8159697.1 glycosyltransferase family 2 protein [Sphingomonas sp. LaA6.9]